METPLSPLEFLRRARKLHGRREAVVDGELRYTYAQFGERIDRASHAFAKLGVKPGDRVALISPNIHGNLESYYSVPQLGGVIVPCNYRLTAEDFVYLIDHSGSTVVCVHPDYIEAVDLIRHRLPNVRHYVAFEGARGDWLDYETLLAQATTDFPKHEPAENDLISVNYTSGTTSRPKGVMMTHRNCWMNSVGMMCHVPMTPAEKYLWTLPMFHANGWTFTWTITAVGGTHVCLRKVDPLTIYETINREGVTLLCAAPTVLIAVANGPDEARKSVKRGVRVITAGAPPAAATIERMEREFGWTLLQAYGLTETAPFISICEVLPEEAALSPSEQAKRKARQGVELITSGQLDVFDEHDQPVPWDGQTMGEIVARGNTVMRGYYNDPEASAKALKGGWFRSGDAAVVHPDGYVEIRDRIKDVIISGGENISTIEVEAALLRHPAVVEVAVVGMPHEKWGETPHAFLVLKNGASLAEGEMKQFARDHLAHFKVPTAFNVVTELPKTATGKIQKFVLRGKRAGIAAQ